MFDFAQQDGKRMEGEGMAGHTPAGCSSPAKHTTKNWRAAPLTLPSSRAPSSLGKEGRERTSAASVGPLMASLRERRRRRETDGMGCLHGRQESSSRTAHQAHDGTPASPKKNKKIYRSVAVTALTKYKIITISSKKNKA